MRLGGRWRPRLGFEEDWTARLMCHAWMDICLIPLNMSFTFMTTRTTWQFMVWEKFDL